MSDWMHSKLRCHECGNPRSVCSDPHIGWYPQRTVCYATMANEWAEATYADMHERRPYHDGTFTSWGEKRTEATPYHFKDGVTLWVSAEDLSPDDDFLGGSPEVTPEAIEALRGGEDGYSS